MKHLALIFLLTACTVDVPKPVHETGDTMPKLPASAIDADTDAGNCHYPKWEVHFSPRGGCTEMVTRLVSEAKNSIYVQAYSFTSPAIGQALLNNKFAKVQILLDKSDETGKNTLLPRMQDAHIPIWIDGKHAIAHNKVMVIDEQIVITGSFNFTMAAENSNAENCIALYDTQLAHLYLENWQKHREHSVDPKAR